MQHPEEIRQRKTAISIALIVGVFMLIAKVSAYFLTSSAAILSDALESVVHIFATSVAFYSIIVSSRPPDRTHPYGHGKIEYFSAGLEGSFIIIAAIVIITEAIRGIIVGRELQHLDTGVYIIAGASAVNLVLGLYLIRVGKRTDSLTLIADGRHVLTDFYTSGGVIAGLTIVYFTGWELLDPLVAIAVALNILYTGGKLIRRSVGGLMNETDTEVLHEMVERLNRHRRESWIDVHQLRTWQSGDKHYIDFHLTVPYYWDIERAHDEQLRISDSLKNLLNGKAEVLIHLDPCRPSCCPFCEVKDCHVRKAPFAARQEWTVEHAVGPPKYFDARRDV
jgi:cation diffusion facilitator family transporter